MALLAATSIFALPTSVLAQQNTSGESRANSADRRISYSFQRDVQAMRNARAIDRRFFFTGPDMSALRNSRAADGQLARSRTYTEEELAEIRAAQRRLVRDRTGGPADPGGGVVLSHPTLGRLVLDISGPLPGNPGNPGSGRPIPDPTMLAGPGSVADPGEPGDPGEGKDPGDPKSGSGSGSSADFPVLEPGRGFAGPTGEPPSVGDPSMMGYDARAIARWDVVPYQEIEGQFHIGVVAFHMNGIDRVEFSVEGGPWEAVREMQLNPRTGVWEYAATLDASMFAGGQVEVRARVYPAGAGQVRVLGGALTEANVASGNHSLIVHAPELTDFGAEVYVSGKGDDTRGDGSRRNPFKTTMRAAHELAQLQGGQAGGGTIFLLEGEHELGPYSYSMRTSTGERFLRITPAEGVDPEDAPLIGSAGSDGLRVQRLLIDGAHIRLDAGTRRGLTNTGHTDCKLWIRNSTMVSSGRAASTPFTGGWTQVYYTDVDVSNAMNGVSAPLVRNVDVHKISSDSFSNSQLVINSRTWDIDHRGTPHHPDIYQVFAPDQVVDNLIVYGLEASDFTSQGLFVRGVEGLTNSAFVNVAFNQAPDHVGYSQIRSPRIEHVLLWHVTHLDMNFGWRTDPDRFGDTVFAKNLSVRNSIFSDMFAEFPLRAEYFSNNHYLNRSRSHPDTSTGATFGPVPMSIPAGALVPAPNPGHPLTSRVGEFLVRGDVDSSARDLPGTLGAIER